MHMADALVSPQIGAAAAVVSTAAIAYSAIKLRKEKTQGGLEREDNWVPVMGVMGAFVFAAQMINFTIPGTGSSGHIGGGILLAAMLGPYASLLTISAVLMIQCLLFADGGLLALGCNILNMGVLPCLVAYPLIYRMITRKKLAPMRISVGSVLAVVVGLELGAFGVVCETAASGITDLPFGAFCAIMLPIHLAIGIVEGLVTAGVLNFVYKSSPGMLSRYTFAVKERGKMPRGKMSRETKRTLIVVFVAALILAGFVSIFASVNPDGLEWAIQNVTGSAELANSSVVQDQAGALVEKTALLPDYALEGLEGVAEGAPGLIGAVAVLVFACLAGVLVSWQRKRKKIGTTAYESNDITNKKGGD